MRNVLSKFLPLVTAALLGVAAFAHPVNATNYTVANGTELLNRASTASPGDTISLTSGVTYPVTVAPAAGNTLRPIVFIGNTTTPITVTDVTPASHTRYYGIAFTNSVDLGSNKRRVMFDHCTMAGMSFKDADSSSVRACTIGGTDFSVNHGDGYMAQSDTLESCTFTSLSATGWYAILFGITDAGIGYVDGFVRRFNTFNISQSGSAAYTPAKHFKTSNMLSYANKFVVTGTATGVGGNEGDFGMVFRDSSHSLTMRRDTLFFNNEGSSFSTYGLLTSSGMGGAYSTSLTNYTIDSCYIRVYNGTPVYLQAQTQGLRFRYNVLRTRNNKALSIGSAFMATSNDPYIHHNTLMGAQAVHFGDQANTGGRFSNNILWGTSSATCDEGNAVAGCSSPNPVSLSDSNFVYSTTGDSTRAFFYTGGCLAPRAGAWAARPNDTHSYWGNPAFTDTSWATLNVQPAAGNFALTGGRWTLGYAGANYTSTVPLAVSAPVIDAKATTAGVYVTITGDADTTASVVGTYSTEGVSAESTFTWYRLPSTLTYATSLFGLQPGTTYTLNVVTTRGASSATASASFTTRNENWWQQPIKGPMVWVAPTGNDTTGTGTYAAPYRTINKGWAILKAKPNYGKGGAVALKAGTYYQSAYLDGAEGYATPDSMYHVVGESGAIISGADERYITGWSWTATGINGVYKSAYQGADSIGTIVIAGHVLHKCTTRTEILTGAGTGGAGAWTYNTYSWYTNGADSIYVRYGGSSPPSTAYIAFRDNLLRIYDKYVRVTGLSFEYAGGASGNGIAARVGTGSCATCSGTGTVLDSCSFYYSTREAIYGFSGSDANSDSVVVADCSFYSAANVLGYAATKGRAEETMAPLGADGAAWTVTRNTMSGWAGGLHHNGGAAFTSTLTNDWDVSYNTITDTGDDALEFDGAYARNHKVFLNTVSNCNNAISLAPTLGGPTFILYNKLRGYDYWGLQSGAFKLGDGGIGSAIGHAVIAHNTCFGDTAAAASYAIFDVGAFANKHVYNNIFQSSATCLYTEYATYWQTCDLDYNLYWRGGGSSSIVQIDDGEGYITLSNLQLSYDLELHGLWTHPAWADTSSLQSAAAANQARRLTGITDKLVTVAGTGPDIGAVEYIAPQAMSTRRRAWLSVLLRIIGRIR